MSAAERKVAAVQALVSELISDDAAEGGERLAERFKAVAEEKGKSMECMSLVPAAVPFPAVRITSNRIAPEH
jgi:hypothetical protein